MSRAVLISIQPKWCEKIASGEKTIEVRKARPKLKPPFKCYIYCTMGRTRYSPATKTYTLSPYEEFWVGKPINNISKGRYLGNGKIIGEFVCDWIEGTCGWRLRGKTGLLAKRNERETMLPELACLSIEEIEKYAGGENGCIYGWHISDLVIYDRPKRLDEFRTWCKEIDKDSPECGSCGYYYYDECMCDGLKHVTRPPQSWCYVEMAKGGRR